MKRLIFTVCVLTARMAAGAQTAPDEQTFTVRTTSALAELCAEPHPATSR